jgi:hypothetical protein
MAELVIERGASELLEEQFENLQPNQRRFLIERISSDTDAEAARATGVSVQAVTNWRNTNASFLVVYEAAVGASPADIARLQGIRFQHLLGRCAEVLDVFVEWKPTDDELSTGHAEHEHKKARLALDIIKTMRGFAPKERVRPPTKAEREVNIMELTQQGMKDNAASSTA